MDRIQQGDMIRVKTNVLLYDWNRDPGIVLSVNDYVDDNGESSQTVRVFHPTVVWHPKVQCWHADDVERIF